MSTTSSIVPSDEEMEDWLQDMMFSGDIQGFARRRKREVISRDFFEYVEERLELTKDEDERGALADVFSVVAAGLKETEGLTDSGVVFEKRLDSILFCAPNKRADLIKNQISNDMTPAFIQYVQDELKLMQDIDGKVVLASILQLIGQVKGGDYLGGAAAILSMADASLGDQFKRADSELDMSGSGGVVENKGGAVVGDRNEQMLANLMFSNNDILEDVLNNLHEIDERFCKFLQTKVDKSMDVEERTALQSLLDTVTSVLDRIKEAQDQGNGMVDEELTMDQVKQRMQEVQMGNEVAPSSVKSGAKAFTVQKDKQDSFKQILSRFVGLVDAQAVEDAVRANYELCDKDFLEMLKSEADACFVEGADAEGKQYQELQGVITRVMAERIGQAQERLQRIFSKNAVGGVKAMESEIVLMVRKGEVDEALTLLIETNAQQAEKAGAKQTSEVLRVLLKRVVVEQERSLPDEQRLLRALLRESDSEKRKELLYTAFKQSKSMSDTHELTEGPPLISPPAFINIAQQFILNFGNVDKMDFMTKVQAIIDEAQIVATDLYGEGMNPRQQQKFMFDKQTVSIWDLANFEDQAMMSGEEIPWRNDKYDNMSPEDVLGERVKRIGGDS